VVRRTSGPIALGDAFRPGPRRVQIVDVEQTRIEEKTSNRCNRILPSSLSGVHSMNSRIGSKRRRITCAGLNFQCFSLDVVHPPSFDIADNRTLSDSTRAQNHEYFFHNVFL